MERDTQLTIGIRADGNALIGMGHLMRCLSIGRALKAEGVRVIFFTADEEGADVAGQEFDCRVLHTDYRQMETELSQMAGYIRQYGIGLILVDSYQITDVYMETLERQCPVFYMDDMGKRIFPATGIVNYNIYGEDIPYAAGCAPGTILLLGSRYAPVKEAFARVEYNFREKVQTILITMGGSDNLNIAGHLCEALLPRIGENVELTLICGHFNPHREALEKLSLSDPRVHVLVDVQDMWNKMAQADIAIAAAGSTMYELSVIGVPAVCCYYVENQRQIAEGFASRTGMINAGDFSREPESVTDRLVGETLELIENSDRRRLLAENMKKVVDGQGAVRLAGRLIRSVGEYDQK